MEGGDASGAPDLPALILTEGFAPPPDRGD